MPIISDGAESLNSLYLDSPVANKVSEFFNSLKNAKNLKSLTLKRLKGINISSLSMYLKDELPSITTLDLSDDTVTQTNIIKDLKGIELFTGLKTLKLYHTSEILDISAIKNCPTLTDVSLTYCNIQSLSGIEALTNLQNLTLNSNNITSLKPIENLKSLKTLNLQNNAISDTSSYIDTDGTTKTYRNLDILAGLHTSNGGQLTSLYLSGNDNIIDYLPVSSLTWSNKSGF